MMKFFDAAGLFRSCWVLYRSYYGQKMTKELWEELIEKADALYQKYQKERFAMEMIMAVINEIERMDKINDSQK